jgi:hypothetical protein
MARQTRSESPTTQLSELLGHLDPIEVAKEKIPARLEESGLETQLLTLADVSLERETEVLRDLVTHARKQ